MSTPSDLAAVQLTPHLPASRSQRSLALRISVVSVLAAALAYVTVKHGVTMALGILLVPAIGYALTRRLGGILTGVTLVLLLPAWYTIGVPQAGVLRVACLCALVTLLFNRQPRISWLDVTLLLLVVVIVMGWLFQDDQPHAGRILLNEIEPVAFYLAARAVRAKDVPRVMTYVFFAGGLGALSVLYEFAVGHALFIDPARYYWNAERALYLFRPGGIFGSPPAAAAVLSLTALCGLPRMRQRGHPLVVRACMLVTLVAIVTTFTRTAFIALGAAFLLYLWLSRSPLLSPQRVLAAVAACLVAFVVVLPAIEADPIFREGVVRPGTLAARQSFWRLAIPVATANTHNLVFGIGSEALEVASLGGVTPAEVASAPSIIHHSLQNQYVLTLVEQGLVGLVALLAWLSASITLTARYARVKSDCYSAALAAGLVVLAITMLADNIMLNGPALAIAFLMAGLAVARRTLAVPSER
jgi:O-antigen ligase